MRIFILAVMCIFSFGCTNTPFNPELNNDEAQVLKIFSAADSQSLEGLNSYLEFVEDDIVLMPHDHPAVLGKNAYKQHIVGGWQGGTTKIKHELIDLTPYQDVVIARGQAVGTFQPKNSSDVYDFKTKNLFVFKRDAQGNLKVSQIIFNMEPQ